MNIQDTEFVVKGRIFRIAAVKDEADLDIPEPIAVLDLIRTREADRFDLFTFGQRLPDTEPKYRYPMEWDRIAALEYQDHRFWFEKILDDKTRNMVRKAGKKDVELRMVDFDDDLVRGIVDIYNEAPIRQGRRFKHYGKSFEDAKTANATHLGRSVFVGAYYGTELIGFMKLVFGDRTARAEQIISKIAHRDKAPTNALLNEAVRLCEAHGVPFLVYGIWPSKESFAHFKKNNGFREYRLPRYYVPLNAKGWLAVKLGMYKEFKQRLPRVISMRLVDIRERWYAIRHKAH